MSVPPPVEGERNVAERSRRAGPLGIAVLAWVALTILGFTLVVRHSLTPGQAGRPPATWPARSALERQPGRWSLVMAVHPRCPCTRASLAELRRLLDDHGASVTAHLLFLRPASASEAWTRTDSWRTATAMPGVHAVLDVEGSELDRFGALTSGDVALYDPSGRLVYTGGITGARGHAGPNAGATNLARAVSAEPHAGSAPVYGCPLSPPEVDITTTKERR